MGKYIWLAAFFIVLIWSGINPKDYFTWFLEVVPALIGLVVLAVTYKSFRLTKLSYILILIHCIILMIGGKYTYAEVPFFNTLKDWFDMSRNNYDKVGHFAQGFIPALLTRELVIRKNVFNSKAWRNFFVVCFCLAFSAFYELIEWWVALGAGADSTDFLGTQGYIWDTQSDMALALLGAILGLALLSRWQDRQLGSIASG
jgi:putative membrane protein